LVIFITETNVPHQENISYFGSGDEARMVYQFALPPLLLHAFIRGDSRFLQKWAKTIALPEGGCTFFNFCASHDGVGVLPAKGILPEEELEKVITETEKRGGLISYKASAHGNIPYELNINYFSAIAEDSLDAPIRARKFIASQSILLAMPGVPGIYAHSIIGSRNWQEGVKQSGISRRVNREKLSYAAFRGEMTAPASLREEVFKAYRNLLAARMTEKAFHPLAPLRILPTAQECFALLRESPPEQNKETSRVLCLTNLCPKAAELSFTVKDLGIEERRCFTELASRDTIYPTWEGKENFSLTLEPFEVLWLQL
jgi:sucrose phosphorylase